MPPVLVNHQVKVNAPLPVLWGIMVDKMRAPYKYLPGITKDQVTIPRDISPMCVERKMNIGPTTMHEIITADEATLTVVYKSVPGAGSRGFVTNTIVEDGQDLYLDYTMQMVFKDESVSEAAMKEKIVEAVEHTKQVAEEQAAAK
jgi:Domain of unknown function (DUF1857)